MFAVLWGKKMIEKAFTLFSLKKSLGNVNRRLKLRAADGP